MALAVDGELVDPRTGEAQQARQQGDRGGHGDGDDEGDGHAHGGDGREPGEEEAEDGDDDGAPREQHRLTRGGVRGTGGILHAHAVVQVLAVAGDDEQRVVDADAEADHHAEDQRELRHVHEGREDADRRGADEDADERSDNGQAHGNDRTERDEQHDDRDTDPDELAARVLLRQLRHLTGEFDADPAAPGAVGYVRRVVELGGGELVDGVRDVDVPRPAVGAGRSRRDAGDVVAVSELVLDPAHGRRVLGVVEATVIGVEHDPGRLAAVAREPVVQHVGRVLGFDARDAEAVDELTAGATLESDDGDGGDDPDAQHPERVAGATAAETEQECAQRILLVGGPLGVRDSGHSPGVR